MTQTCGHGVDPSIGAETDMTEVPAGAPPTVISDKNGDTNVAPLHLGRRLRQLRKENQWTLQQASTRIGISKSSLSKIENEQMSPTFEVMQKLARGLQIDMPQLFAPTPKPRVSGRRSLTRSGDGRPYPTATYDHTLLCVDMVNKKLLPYRTIVRARSFDDFGDWVRHEGEEFLFVLSGCLTFYCEFYEPIRLQSGDSLYYDSAMGHACVSESEKPAEILWVSTK